MGDVESGTGILIRSSELAATNEQVGFDEAYWVAAEEYRKRATFTVDTLFTQSPSIQASKIRESLTTLLSAEIVAKHMAADDAKWTTHQNQKHQMDFLALNGFDAEAVDGHATNLLEEFIFAQPLVSSEKLAERDKSPTLPEGALSAGILNTIMGHARWSLSEHFSHVRRVHTTAENDFTQRRRADLTRDAELIDDEVIAGKATITKALALVQNGTITVRQAIRRVSRALEPLMFEHLGASSHRLETVVNKPEYVAAAKVLGSRPMSWADRRALLGGKVVNFGPLKLSDNTIKVTAQGKTNTLRATMALYEREIQSTLRLSKEDEAWKSLTQSERTSASLLLLYNKATLSEKTRMLIQDPELVRVMSKLPKAMQAHFRSWGVATLAARAVDYSAATFAQEAAGSAATLAHWIKTKGAQTGNGFKNFFSSPLDSSQPDGPRKPRWGRILLATTVVGGAVFVLWACTGGLDDNSNQPANTPTTPPTPDLTLDLIATLEPALGSQVSQFDTVGCTVKQSIFDSMEDSGASSALDAQFGWMALALNAPDAPTFSTGTDLVCVIGANGQSSDVYIKEQNGNIWLPTIDGLVPGMFTEDGIVIPIDQAENGGQASDVTYPPNGENLLVGAGGSIEQVWEVLRAFAPNDVAAQESLFNLEASRMGLTNYELVPSYLAGKSWIIAVRDTDTGRFYVPALTNADGTHLIISDLSMFPYEATEGDFFDLLPLKNPLSHPNAIQQIVPDRSGIHVIGLFENGELIGYYDGVTDAWKNPGGELLASTVVIATDTPPPTLETVDISKWTGLPESLADFESGHSLAFIFDTLIPGLNATESKFAESVTPVAVEIMYTMVGNEKVPERVLLICNEGSENCIPVATVRVGNQYVLILKIKNADTEGSNGFFPWFIGGQYLSDVPVDKIIKLVLANPTGPRRIEIEIAPTGVNAQRHPIIKRYATDVDFRNAMLKFAEDDVFPSNFRDIIPANSFR